MDPLQERGALAAELTRRSFIQRASAVGLGAALLSAAPLARELAVPGAAQAAPASDAVLQAFADTIIPGRKASRTDLGNRIEPRAIAGVDHRPGAVEADALVLYRADALGFPAIEPEFYADLVARTLPYGVDFVSLPFDKRVAVCKSGLDFGNPLRLFWEAAAAVPFTAFCAAGANRDQTAAKASGYRVMGLPGKAPRGYRGFSYRRKLARERTKRGYLP